MPFDPNRIIDHQLYLATQQCIQPYAQQRRVSSPPATTAAAAAAAAGPATTAGTRMPSLGSLGSPWSSSGGGGSSSSSSGSSRRKRYLALYNHRPGPSTQGYSPVDLFFTAPVGIPVRGGGGVYGGGDQSCSSPDQFVTAPAGSFTTCASAASAAAVLSPPQRQHQDQHGDGSRPGSSDTNWTFATASGGSGTGSFSGLDTTVDLTSSPPPSPLQMGKTATPILAAAAAAAAPPTPPRHPSQEQQKQPPSAGTAPPRAPDHNRVTAITLEVQDLQRTRRSYEHVSGAPCLSSSCPSEGDEGEDGRSVVLRLNGGALVLTLRELPPDERRGDGPAGGGGEVQLTVPVDDAGEVCRRLRGLAEEGREEEEGEGGSMRVKGGGGCEGQRFAEPVTGPRGRAGRRVL